MPPKKPPARPDPFRPHVARLSQMMQSRNFSGALPQLVNLRKEAPRDARVLWMLGVCNAELGRHAEAIEALGAATQADPENTDLRLTLITALQRGGEHDRALLEIERVLFRRPDSLPALRMRCSVLMDMGRWDKAGEMVGLLMASPVYTTARPPEQIACAVTAARLAPEHRDAQMTIDQLEPLAADTNCPSTSRIAACWHLGRLHDKLGRFDKAFAAYTMNKTLSATPWNAEEHARRIDRLIAAWPEDCKAPCATRDGSRLVFILGMMRSGTSLTEQMLAQLPGVAPGGEMNAVSRQVAVVDPVFTDTFRPMPINAARYTGETMQRMARDAWAYYDRVAQDGVVTDKQPYNFYYVPLIARMFPGCKIVHCTRDPQDTCLSNYFQSFSRPHAQTHDLETLGRYYRDYERAMDAWRGLSWVNMVDLRYEDLVADPRTHLGRVIDFIGLSWDDAVLSFHESDRTVRTSSRDQVRQPLYRSSVKKHEQYAEFLAPLRRGLGLE